MGKFINGFILISILCTIGFIYGLLMFLSDFEPNKCEMTYMFEYPQFVRISVPEDQYFKKYSLYAYSEGRLTQKSRNMQFDGIPVLFIPGNAGSYKQVRSLASVALRKSINSRTTFHFDYFTIDTNGELSGTNGVLLNDQMTYANYSMHRILNLYPKGNRKPNSIILIGHSMGGIVAKGLATSLRKDSTLIPLIITLAAPHQRLPIVFDYYAHRFYSKIASSDDTLSSLVVSVYGGHNDFMVSPNLAKSSGVSAVVTHVPKTWLSTDHLCILWCKQLILVINKALFESVDYETKQLSTDKNYVRNVFENNLLTNSGIKTKFRDRYEIKATIDTNGEWIEYLPRQYSIKLIEGTKNVKYYMIRLFHNPKHEMLSLMAINLKTIDWVYVCSASEIQGNSRVCSHGKHLSHLSLIAPSKRQKRRTFDINLHALQEKYPAFSHVIVKIPITSDPITLHVDIFENNQRRVEVKLPNQFMQRLTLKKQVIVEETIEKAIRYQLDFPKLTHIMQVFLLHVEPVKCHGNIYHTTATVVSPWSGESYHHHFTEVDKDPLVLRLFASKPYDNDNTGAYVQLTLDPECRYKISIEASISKQFAQFARYYSPFIFSSVASVTLLVLVYQLKGVCETQHFPMFLTGLKLGAKPYYFLPIVKIASQILSIPILLKIFPRPDWNVIQHEGLNTFLTPILLYLAAVGIVWVLSLFLMITLFVFESTIHKIVLKLISKTIQTPASWSDWVLSGFQKFPTLVAACLIAISTTTCGGLALALGCMFYFFKLTQISQDVIENIVKKLLKIVGVWIKQIFKKSDSKTAITSSPVEKDNEQENDDNEDKPTTSDKKEDENEGIFLLLREVLENNELFFHFTMFSLWFLVTCINIPTTLTWAHNFKYNPKLIVDPSFIPGLILCGCAIPLWQMELPKVSKKGYIEISYIIYFLAVIGQIYGVFSLYVLNYTLTGVIFIVVLHQLLAPRELTTNDDGEPSFKDAKAKME
nr:GPI inositol-deacylase [Onthophagus taurus]